MALSAHELILVLRARDEASRVLRNLEGNITGLSAAQQRAAQKQISQGQALATVGVGIAAAGAVGLKFFADSIGAANEYNRTVALTRTQVDDTRVSLKQLSDIGVLVAKTIPVPFEEIQPMLYDIFSSMDVNVTQAKNLLIAFSRSAVAGQVSLQESGRATIAILNAYRLPAQKVNEVNDFMFQLVRKGVGTYGEFASTIGRSIPAAVRAGQTYQQLGGMLAFLTRNGLSTSMATASAGRALDAISNPKTVDRLEHFGQTVATALGKPEAIRLFGSNWQNAGIKVKDANGNFLPMTSIMQQLSKAIIGLPAPQRAEVLQTLFKGSGGTIQARRFFDIAIPGIKEFTKLTQQMYNNRGAADAAYKMMLQTPAMQAQLLKNNFDALRIEIGNYLMPTFQGLLGFGNKMFQMWNGLPQSVRRVVVIVGAATAAFALVVGVVVAVAGAILMLQGAAALAGTGLLAVVGPIVATVAVVAALTAGFILAYQRVTWFHNAVNATPGVLKNLWDWTVRAWAAVRNAWDTGIKFIVGLVQTIWAPIYGWIQGIIANFMSWFNAHAEELKSIWNAVVTFFRANTAIFQNVILPILKAFWQLAVVLFKGSIAVIKALWTTAWEVLLATAKVAWTLIYNGLAIAWHIISGAFSIFIDLITGHWGRAWQDMKNMVTSIWANLKSIWATWMSAALTMLRNVGSNLLEGLKNGILGTMKGMGSWLWNNLVNPIIQAVRHFFGMHSPSTVFADMGGDMIAGLIQGLMHDPAALVGKIFGGFPAALSSMLGKGFVQAKDLTKKAFNALGGFFGSGGGGPGSAIPGLGGVKQWDNVILAALGALGLGAEWLPYVERRMARESGGNPRAINLWDINAQHGDPSKGLMQVIGSTFAAFGGPFKNRGIYDPLANVYAGLNYAIHRYGSLAALDRPGGYAIGTDHATPGWHRVGDRGPELMYMNGGERVASNAEMRRMHGGVHKNVNVTQTIYTHEIDPRAHGAALAWEVATQVAG